MIEYRCSKQYVVSAIPFRLPYPHADEVDALLSRKGGLSFVIDMYFPTFDCSVS